jgi:hypothetical protein
MRNSEINVLIAIDKVVRSRRAAREGRRESKAPHGNSGFGLRRSISAPGFRGATCRTYSNTWSCVG